MEAVAARRLLVNLRLLELHAVLLRVAPLMPNHLISQGSLRTGLNTRAELDGLIIVQLRFQQATEVLVPVKAATNLHLNRFRRVVAYLLAEKAALIPTDDH